MIHSDVVPHCLEAGLRGVTSQGKTHGGLTGGRAENPLSQLYPFRVGATIRTCSGKFMRMLLSSSSSGDGQPNFLTSCNYLGESIHLDS
jgi:hypothetical protein